MKSLAGRWTPPVALVAAAFCTRIARAAELNCSFTCDRYPHYSSCPDIIITSQTDIDEWGACGNFTGNVVIQNSNLTTITLNGFENIYDGGLLVANCAELVEFSAPNLQTVVQNFTLSNLPQLTNISLPVVGNIGSIVWDSLPLFKNVTIGTSFDIGNPNFDNGDFDLETVWITNTGLDDLDFYGQVITYMETFQVTDNPHLNNISFPYLRQLGPMVIARNGPTMTLSLPQVTLSSNVSISNVAHINVANLNSMEYSGGDITLTENSFQKISIPQVQDMEGSLHISDNPYLTTLDFYALATVRNNIIIEDNPLLQIFSMPNLAGVYGTMNLTGNFSRALFPELDSLANSFHFNTTNATFDCTPFDKANYVYITDYQKWERTKNKPYGYSYSCSAHAPGSTKDTARHYHPPRKPLSQSAKKGLIAMGIVLGIIVIIGINRWHWWKHPHPKPDAAGGGEVVPLEEVSGGVVRAEDEEEGDHPPKYARVGRAGEVPPGYEGSLNSRAELSVQETTTDPPHLPPDYDAVASVPTKKKKKKGFWRRIWS